MGFRGRDTRSLHGSLMLFAGFDPYASDKEVQKYQEMRSMRSSRFLFCFSVGFKIGSFDPLILGTFVPPQ